MLVTTLISATHEANGDIYVVKGLDKRLLGQPAIKELNLVHRVTAVSSHKLNPRAQFPTRPNDINL